MATVDDKNRIPFTNKVLVLETSALFFVDIEFKGCFTKHFQFKWRDNAPLLEVFVLLLQNTAEKHIQKSGDNVEFIYLPTRITYLSAMNHFKQPSWFCLSRLQFF